MSSRSSGWLATAVLPVFFLGSGFLPFLQPKAFPDQGDFKIIYKPSPNQELDTLRELVQQSGVFDEIVAGLNAALNLPYDILIRFEDNSEGPYQQGDQIVINYQFLDFHANLFVRFEYSENPEELAEALLGLAEFVLYHEIGHALVGWSSTW